MRGGLLATTRTELTPSLVSNMRAQTNPAKKKEEGAQEEGEKNTMTKIKEAGTAGLISYIFWEWAFWGISIPVCIFGYREVTGHWPDFKDQEDLKKLGAEAFAFVNVARFAIPLRIGLALSTTPWVKANIVSKFQKEGGDDGDGGATAA